MSRALLGLGLLISIILHGALLLAPAPSSPSRVAEIDVLPVVEQVVAASEPEPPSPEGEPRATERIEPPPRTQPPAPRPPVEPAPERALAPPAAPAPELVQTARDQTSEADRSGDFGGTPEGAPGPILRIDWGTAADALATIDAGGMRIVLLHGRPPQWRINDEMTHVDGVWRRAPYGPRARYSNHLRVVDDVPAFREVRAAARPSSSERLAVLLPVEVERTLQTAQIEAAFATGLTMDRIRDFGGLFSVEDGALAFEITHVEETR